MADQITDGRTLLDAADAVTNFVDLTGAASGTLDTEIKIQSTGSIGYSTQNTRDGLLFNAGTAQDWSNNTFYLWVNCGIVGLLATKANGGLTIRFCGATVTDWFEVRIAGGDSWPVAVSGGWTMFVVSIEAARAAAVTNGWTNGTTPATTAIQYVGISTITNGTMPRMVDNTWLDAIWRLPSGSPGILVEGQNGGSTPWTWNDIRVASETNAWGTARSAAGGAVAINTPVEFGIDDGTTHAFTSSNEKVLWEDQEFIDATLYGITVLGAATGSQNWSMGVKSGTGDTATGAQGGLIAAAATGARWYFDADASNIDLCGLYGVSFEHASDFQLDGSTVESISCLFVDCTSAAVLGAAAFLRNAIIAANTADGVAFCFTDDISDVKFCEFQFSDGHGVEIQSGGSASQSSQGNTFSGYGGTPGSNGTPSSGSTDAAVYNNSGASITINVTDGGDSPSVRNGASATTTVQAAITITFTNIVADTEVRVYLTGTSTEVDGTESSAGTSFAASLQASTGYDVVAIKPGYIPVRRVNVSFAGSQDFPLNLSVDLNFRDP